ncbi:hypothetical protein BJX61DRAFT_126285 [Aspergillus egyptiacus]|nr:hypothetical protein BJX61DRAFT_126285 [Aspergillus egyptiacus]
MKPRTPLYRGFLTQNQNAHPIAVRSPVPSQRRHATASSSARSQSSTSSRRPWLRLPLVTVAAIGIGAYFIWTQDSRTGTSTVLNPARFTRYYLVSREAVSSTGSLFTLRPPKLNGENRGVYEGAWKTGLWSVMFKQPQLQIGRDYTPLPPLPADEDGECLRFFIRKDPFGEVSRYLHGLRIGAPIEVRGPRIECEVPSDTQNILFIAGGTGIAPALQAGYTLLRRTNENYQPRIHIMWASRQREDCKGGHNDITEAAADETQRSWLARLFKSSNLVPSPAPNSLQGGEGTSVIVQELEALKSRYPGQVTVEYFVDEESTFIGDNSILRFTRSAASPPGSPKRNMILVSGPEGFISYMAGPKLWAQGMELQGPLQGIIKQLDLSDWAVWKL